MSKQQGAKHELLLANLINESRETLNLLVVGRADENGLFPNSHTNFVLRKMRLIQSKRGNWRGSELHELTIPRTCVPKLLDVIQRTIAATKDIEQARERIRPSSVTQSSFSGEV